MNSFIRSFPFEINEIMKNVREGKLKIEVEDWETKKLTKKIDLAANRLVLAFLISSLLIGSAIIMNANPGTDEEVPVLSIAGFVIAILLSIPLIIAGFKKDKD
jgi:ubiquinone biosynthesis protein